MEPRDIGSRISPSGFREKTLPTNSRDLSLTKSATTLKYAKCSFQNKKNPAKTDRLSRVLSLMS